MNISQQENNFKQKDLFKKQFIFVMGSPRSGTTLIHKMLSEHPDVASLTTLKELTTFTHYLAHFDEWWNIEKERCKGGKWVQGLPLVWSDEEYEEFVYSFLYRIYSKLENKKPEASHILDKHPGYILNIDLIKKFFPNSKLIHIVRDGRDVVLSMYEANKKVGFASQLVDKNIRLWSDSLKAAENLNKYQGDFFEFKYEDLRHNMKNLLVEICKLCNLDTSSQIIDTIVENNAFGQNMVSWPNEKISQKQREEGNIWKSILSIKEKYLINRIAGNYLKKYGYVQENSWWYNSVWEKYVFYTKRTVRGIVSRFANGLKWMIKGKF